MALVSKLEYKPEIDKNGLNSNSIISMLKDIRKGIGFRDESFANMTLEGVAEVVSSRRHSYIEKGITYVVDLMEAAQLLDIYKEGSERSGCSSCVHKASVQIDDGPSRFFDYCKLWEGDHEKARSKETSSMYSSPMVLKHNDNPCDTWNPRFSPKLAELTISAT